MRRNADDLCYSNHQALPLGSQTYTGDLTYYGPGLGACGVTSGDDDHIVSISHFVFDAVSTGSNPNANPLCGHKLRAVWDGNSIDLTVVDRCVFPFLAAHQSKADRVVKASAASLQTSM